MTIEVRHYVTASGKDVFQGWLDRLRDRQAQARVQARVDRLERGLFGDVEPARRRQAKAGFGHQTGEGVLA